MALPKVSSLGFYDTTTVSLIGFKDEEFSTSGSGGSGSGVSTTLIKHGLNTVSALYSGSTQITKVYVGSTQVFPAN